MFKLFALACTLLIATGCSGSVEGQDGASQDGREGEACYPNGTCDSGLSCLSKLCVALNNNGGSGSGGSGASGSPATAGSGSVAGTGSVAGSGPSGAGTSGSGVGGSPSAPECHTVHVTNATASERVNAALCVGFGFDDHYSCTYMPTADETRCIGAASAYVVVYTETNNGTVGDIYALSSKAHFGVLFQATETGEFEIYLDSGATASCVINGDIGRFCTP